MSSLAGRLLVGTPTMGDPNFERTVVWMLEHGPHGAAGVVLNRASAVPVAMHLPALADRVAPPDVFFVGGPVQTEAVIGLGLEGDDVTSVDLDDVLAGRQLTPRLRLYAGYAGWGALQLEGELAEEAWFVVDGTPDDVFNDQPEELWGAVLRRQGGRLGRVAMYPPSPLVN